MQLDFALDEFGRLIASLAGDRASVTVTASNVPGAGAGLAEAVEEALDTGFGECWWEEGGGVYRWLLRREADRLTVVVLWSTGTITGWEDVFRGECDAAAFAAQVRDALARLAQPA
jgi:hypothetical protein